MNLLDLFNPDDINSNSPVIPAQPMGIPTKAAAEALGFDPSESNEQTSVSTPNMGTASNVPQPEPVASSSALMKALKSLDTPTSSQPGFGDIINAFKEGGAKSGFSKVGEYLNSPEGIQLIGGLVSSSKPYAGLSMVDSAQKSIQARNAANLAAQAPLSNADKYKLALEMSHNDVDLKMNMAKLGLDWNKFNVESGQKNQEIGIQQQNSDIEKQKLAIEQKKAAVEEQKANQDLNQMPTDKLIETYKGKISPEDAQTLMDAAKNGTQGNYQIKRSVVGTLIPGAYSFKVVPKPMQAAGQTTTGNRFVLKPINPNPENM